MKGLLISLLVLPFRIIAPVLLIFVLPFALKVEDSVLADGVDIQRYRLPNGFRWLETPDQLMPCDMRIKDAALVYKYLGAFAAAWYWLGVRNVGHGIAWGFGKEAPNYMVHLSPDVRAKYGVYENRQIILCFEVITGYAIYRDFYSWDTNAGFWSVPRCSVRMSADAKAKLKAFKDFILRK